MVDTQSFGLSVSATGAAFDAWDAGLVQANAFDNNGIENLKAAVELEPDFALAHALLARQQMAHGFGEDGFQSLARANETLAIIGGQEASTCAVTIATTSGDPHAKAMAKAHLEQWPDDMLVLANIVGPFGLNAFSGNLLCREENAALLGQYEDKRAADDWWYWASYGFALGEIGQLAKAETLAKRAYGIIQNGNCAHTLSHIQFEQENWRDGRALIDEWAGTEIGSSSDIRQHLHWHRALIDLETGIFDDAAMEALFIDELDPDAYHPLPISTLADNASLLWRCHMRGMPVGRKHAEAVWAFGCRHIAGAGFLFGDIHMTVAAALLGEEDALAGLKTRFEALENKKDSALLCTLADGYSAYTKGEFAEAASVLKPVLPDVVRLGGSNPQRAVTLETYADAAARAAA